MTELIRTLYDYAYKRHMTYYLDDEVQYHESDIMSDRQYKALQAQLNEQGRQHLENYLDEIKLMHNLELDAMFRAGLSLGQELSRL